MIVEDGSIVPNADSGVDLEFAAAYAEARFNIEWLSTPDPEAALVLGTSWVMNRHKGNWKGQIVDVNQTLAWPRKYVYDAEWRLLPSDEIPLAVKQAIVEAAFRFGRDDDLYADPQVAGNIKRERVRVDGAIEEEIEYADVGSVSSRPTVTIVDDLLRGLLLSGGGRAGVIPVLRM